MAEKIDFNENCFEELDSEKYKAALEHALTIYRGICEMIDGQEDMEKEEKVTRKRNVFLVSHIEAIINSSPLTGIEKLHAFIATLVSMISASDSPVRALSLLLQRVGTFLPQAIDQFEQYEKNEDKD